MSEADDIEVKTEEAAVRSEVLPPFIGFLTAGKQTVVGVAQSALEHVRDTTMRKADEDGIRMNDEGRPTVVPPPAFSGFQKAGGGVETVDEKALAAVRNCLSEADRDNSMVPIDEDQPCTSTVTVPAFSGFRKAGGGVEAVDDEAFVAARSCLNETDQAVASAAIPSFMKVGSGIPEMIVNYDKVQKRLLERQQNIENAEPNAIKRLRHDRRQSIESNRGVFISPFRRHSTEPILASPSTPIGAQQQQNKFRSPLVSSPATNPTSPAFPSPTARAFKMTTISAAMYDKYAKRAGGRVNLSVGYIQRYLESSARIRETPILQIMRFKYVADPTKMDGNVARARVFDVAFFGPSVLTQLTQDALNHDPDRCEIIAVTRIGNPANFHINGKVPLVIEAYDLIDASQPLLGDPVTHEGDPTEHRDFEPQGSVGYPVIRGAGPVKRSSSADSFDDESPPRTPAAKQPRKSNGTPVTPGRLSMSTPMSRNSANLHVTPISMLTPYLQKWRICGAVTTKEEMKTVRGRQNSDLQVFNFTLTDADGSSIRIASFGEVADKFFTLVQKGCTFYVSNATVRQANAKFNTTGHSYELSLRMESEVTLCTDFHVHPPPMQLKPVALDKLAEHEGQTIDLLAVLHKVDEPIQFTSRAGKEMVKRALYFVDESCKQAVVTLWNEQAKNFETELIGQIFAIKGVNVGSYQGGVQLSAYSSTILEPNPLQVPGAARIQGWYSRVGRHEQFENVCATGGGGAFGHFEKNFHLLGPIVESKMGGRGVDEYANIVAQITTAKSDQCMYMACPSCNKKVQSTTNNDYRCEHCNQNFEAPNWRYMLQVELTDFTGSIWTTLFDEQAKKIIGKDAHELAQIKAEGHESALADIVNEILFKTYTFRVRARTEVYNEEARIKYAVLSVDVGIPNDYEPCLEKLTTALGDLHSLHLKHEPH